MQSKDEESGTVDDLIHWDDVHPKTLEQIQAMLHKTKQAALKRERSTISCAFSNQVLIIYHMFCLFSFCNISAYSLTSAIRAHNF